MTMKIVLLIDFLYNDGDGPCESKSKARRLLEQNGIKIHTKDGFKLAGVRSGILTDNGLMVQFIPDIDIWANDIRQQMLEGQLHLKIE